MPGGGGGGTGGVGGGRQHGLGTTRLGPGLGLGFRGVRATRVLRSGVRLLLGKLGRHAFDRAERQTQAGGAVPRDEIEPLATKAPALRAPSTARRRRERQHIGDRRGQPAVEQARKPASLFGRRQVGAEGIHAHRDLGLFLQLEPGILVGGLHGLGVDSELRGERAGEALGIGDRRSRRSGHPVAHERGSVAATDDLQRPAREAFPRILLAVSVQQQSPRGETGAQRMGERETLLPLGVAEGGGVPLRQRGMQARREGRLSADGELQARRRERGIGAQPGRGELGPDFLGKRRGRARLVTEALHVHGEDHAVRGDVARSLDGGSRRRSRRARQRDVTLAAEQAARGVEAHPAAARDVDLGPGVEIHHVPVHALRRVGDHPFVLQLHQVAADEASGEASRAQHGHQQYRRVPTAPATLRERLLRRPDARLFADDVAKTSVRRRAEGHDQVDRRSFARLIVEEGLEERTAGERRVGRIEVRREVGGDGARVGEGNFLGERVDEEVERVIRPHVDRELHPQIERQGAPEGREGQPRDVVVGGVLLPAQFALRLDAERIGLYLGLGVRRRPEADGMRA